MSIEEKPADLAAGYSERIQAYLAEARTRPLPVSGADAQGGILPLSPEQAKAQIEAAGRLIDDLHAIPDDDPPDALEQVMRGIDENRPTGQKLFEGMF
jgi:hypothetical protein